MFFFLIIIGLFPNVIGFTAEAFRFSYNYNQSFDEFLTFLRFSHLIKNHKKKVIIKAKHNAHETRWSHSISHHSINLHIHVPKLQIENIVSCWLFIFFFIFVVVIKQLKISFEWLVCRFAFHLYIFFIFFLYFIRSLLI